VWNQSSRSKSNRVQTWGKTAAFPPGFSRDRHKSRESGLRYALIGSGRVMALAVSAHRSPRGEVEVAKCAGGLSLSSMALMSNTVVV
jgi:hypothetical protein